MHINCPQPDLLNAVQKVQRAVATNDNLPYLTGILIKAHNNKLTLHSTDLDLGIKFSFETEVLIEGDILLPARIFAEMVRKLPPIDLSIKSLDNNMVEITYHQSKIQLNCFDPSNFPSFPTVEASFQIKSQANILKEAIRKVSIATNSDDLQSIFNAILLEKKQDQESFNLVATDTHRLAVYNSNGIRNSETTLKALVGSRALNELARMLSNDESQVILTVGPNQIVVEHENLVLYARLLNDKFPHYRQIIPQSASTTLKINTKELLETTERATLLARDELKPRSHLVMLKIDDTLKISSEAAEVGKLEEELTADIEGQPIEIAFNGRYLLDTLKVIDSQEVVLEMQAPLKPIVVKPADNDNYLCLILPVRIHKQL
ncbi:MAG: DNA polymerase III subunit beta [Clostridia bacterium]|nr:DNA polymerase III subunit beta [Clostridia bacterium]